MSDASKSDYDDVARKIVSAIEAREVGLDFLISKITGGTSTEGDVYVAYRAVCIFLDKWKPPHFAQCLQLLRSHVEKHYPKLMNNFVETK